jgi:hypothetical protein
VLGSLGRRVFQNVQSRADEVLQHSFLIAGPTVTGIINTTQILMTNGKSIEGTPRERS